MNYFGLSTTTIDKIKSVFKLYPEIDEVIIFGSRAKGNYRDNSDIDLTIKGNGISLTILQQIEIKLEELYIPNTIDILNFEKIENSNLKEHIAIVGKPFYKK